MTDPLLNCDEPYWQYLREAVIGLLPDTDRVEAFVESLRVSDRDVGTVRVLCGADGAHILDRTGSSHGLLARFVRLIENLGYDQETFSLFNEGLEKGESIVAVPSSPNDCHDVGRIMANHSGHAVFYFGNSSAISLTGP